MECTSAQRIKEKWCPWSITGLLKRYNIILFDHYIIVYLVYLWLSLCPILQWMLICIYILLVYFQAETIILWCFYVIWKVVQILHGVLKLNLYEVSHSLARWIYLDSNRVTTNGCVLSFAKNIAELLFKRSAQWKTIVALFILEGHHGILSNLWWIFLFISIKFRFDKPVKIP